MRCVMCGTDFPDFIAYQQHRCCVTLGDIPYAKLAAFYRQRYGRQLTLMTFDDRCGRSSFKRSYRWHYEIDRKEAAK
jgi:hypothetical protein